MAAIRTIVFFVIYSISILVFTPLVLLGRLHSIKGARFFAVSWTKLVTYLAKWICGIKWEVSRGTSLPDTPVIVLAKHQSTWETFFLRWYLPDAAWVAKKELSKVPFFGWAMAATAPIFIDRKSGSKAFDQLMKKSKERFEENESVLLFPEGTRQRDYTKPVKYKIGGAKLAHSLQQDIVPIAHNAGYFWPAKLSSMKPGTIKVVIGKPISPKGKTVDEIQREVQSWIESKVDYLK